MAKGQQKGNRESKKPKKEKIKTIAAAPSQKVRGGTAKARSLCRPVRRIPRGAGVGLEDLPGALRQQQILGGGAIRSVVRCRR
jgi:hypothetical protein